jgi:oligoendopeptidase F
MTQQIPHAAAASSKSPEARTENPAYQWNLEDLFASLEAWEQARSELERRTNDFRRFTGTLGKSPQTLLSALEFSTTLWKDFNRLGVYAGLKSDENTRHAGNLERRQRAVFLSSTIEEASSFFRPEVREIGKSTVERFLAEEPRLEIYRFKLMEIFRLAKHTLGLEAERVISSASLIASGPHSIYSIFSNADMPWPRIRISTGEEVRVDHTTYHRIRASPCREDRKAVFEAFWNQWKGFERTLGTTLYSQIKTDIFYARARHYPNSLARALSDDHVPEAVFRCLVAEANAGLPILHRYFRLRARMLKVDDLRYYDLYPPLVEVNQTVTIDEACRLTVESAAPLGSEYQQALELGLSSRWMHTFPQEGKESGAYMNGSGYDVHPYVLMNYTNDFDSLTTLVHEWGHAMHSVLANRSQPFINAGYSTFTAEVASITPELLLSDHLETKAADDEERLGYLGNLLERLRTTFFRQVMFSEFEALIHETAEQGEALSGERLTRLYLEMLRRYHGHEEGVMQIDDLFGIEWAFIPHFYYNFYVFQYATSMAAASAFAERIASGEASEVERYLDVLRAGGSDHPYRILLQAGIDLASPEPYRALLRRMDRTMDEIEAILERRASGG